MAGTHRSAPEQGWLWGEPSAPAAVDLQAVRERRGSALLRDAFQHAEDGMLVFDLDGVVAELNAQAGRLLGLRKGSSLALDARLGAEAQAALRASVEVALHGGSVADAAFGLRDGMGQAVSAALSCRPVRDAAGRLVGAFCTIREAGAAPSEGGEPAWLGQESGRLVHDFNNALTVLLGNLSLAVDDAQGQQAELLLAAQEGGIAARRITQELPGRLRAAARAAGPAVRHDRAATWPIAGWNVSPAAGLALRSFEPRLLRRLLVRVGHAVFGLAGHAGPVWLRAELPPGREAAEIEIAIGWPGASPGDEKLRLAEGRLRRVLAAVGGRAQVTAHQGGGSLTMRLPVAGPAMAREGRPRILLMDDEQPVRELAARILSREGYDVSEAAEGEAAIALYREADAAGRPFSLAVLDLTVPGGMGGEEAGRRLREISPDLPVLISSGRMQGMPAPELGRLGFAGIVPKPYTAAELRAGVRKALGAHRRTSA
jgi:CheY-like chemotaxis protein